MSVYLDNASTTNVSKSVYKAMKPYLKEEFGNPSSLHNQGIVNRKVINKSRKTIANLLQCSHKEIFFTSCGTESINWALKGLAFKNKVKSEIITTKSEHHATLHAVQFLESIGYTIHYIDVDEEGFMDLNQLKNTINNNTLVVSVLLANNEIGTIQDINEIAKICTENSTYLHVDAVQAICHINVNLTELNADLVSISGHKFHAPKGIGILYIKEGTPIENLIHGGQQENDKRAGTENVPYIVGITKALEDGISTLESYSSQLNENTQFILDELDNAGIEYRLNGPKIGEKRLPGNLNISFKDLDGDDITYYLNKENIYVSTGSACDTKTIEPSHVLRSIHVPENYIDASLRISLSLETKLEDIKFAVNKLIEIIQKVK